MPDAIPFDPSPDVLYHGVPLRHVVELPVLGVPVHFASNSQAALAVVAETFGSWGALRASPGLIAPQGVRVRLIVHEGDERRSGDGAGGSHAPVTVRMPDADRVIMHTPGSIGIADSRRQEAIAYITPALLADRAHVQYSMIEGLTLNLVTARDRHPVHAAAIARGKVALLLAGPPGTGKSTLGYQAYRRGLRVLSDDAVYVQVNPEFRVWGLPGRLRLLTRAVTQFPELAGKSPTFLANGDEKLVVQIPGEWPAQAAPAPVATRARVCLLERTGAATVSKVPASRAEVQAFLTEGIGLSRARFGASLDEALGRLAGEGGWRVSLSSNPADAMPLIDEMLAELDSPG